jgi:hypothetical protein
VSPLLFANRGSRGFAPPPQPFDLVECENPQFRSYRLEKI